MSRWRSDDEILLAVKELAGKGGWVLTSRISHRLRMSNLQTRKRLYQLQKEGLIEKFPETPWMWRVKRERS